LCLQRTRRGKKEDTTLKKKMVVSRYIPYNQTPFVRKVTLFRPNPKSAPKKRSKWNTSPDTRPRSRPWSAIIKQMRGARTNVVSPMKRIRPKLHGNDVVF